MRKTIEEVLAEAAIKDVQIRYCRANDRMDFELMRTCFHADATVDFGFMSGGLEDFINMAKTALPGYTHTTHFTGNQLVQVNGDSAWAEHTAIAIHRCATDADGPERDFSTIVRYIDRMECRDGDWRIARRVLILDAYRTDPVPDLGPSPAVQAGKRDLSDASYAGKQAVLF